MNANRSPLMNSSGNVLAVVLGQRRLGIEQIDLRRRAGHEQVDDALRLRGKSSLAASGGRALASQRRLVDQRGQREAADAEGGLLEEMAARDGAEA